MPYITGSFSGRVTQHSGLPVSDQPGHELAIGAVAGTQSSDEALWNGASITYWAVTDVTDGNGTQRGYYNNVHPDGGRDWGTFEGKVTTSGGTTTVEGEWRFAGGDGQYRGIAGGGTFKTVMKSETELEATWDGTYELARAQAG